MIKKFWSIYTVVILLSFGLVACKQEKESGIIDVSKDAKSYGLADDETAYGPVVHKGVLVDQIKVKSMKIAETTYAYTIYLKGKTGSVQAVGFICDIRTNGSGIQHNLKNDEGYVPKGDLELSLMNYQPGVTDIREADEAATPVFSTSSENNNYISVLRNLNKLNPKSTVAFTVDKEQEDGYTKAIAWSYLIPVEDLIEAMGTINTPCENVPLALDEQHVFGIDTQK